MHVHKNNLVVLMGEMRRQMMTDTASCWLGLGRISQCIGRIILFAVHSVLAASSRELFLIRRNILRQFCLPFRKTLPAIRYMAKEQDRNGKLQTEI